MAKSTAKRNNKRSEAKGYATYLHKLLKQGSHDKKVTISKQAMEVVNALLESVEQRVSNRAFQLVKFQKKQTLSAAQMQVATKNVFPPEMGGQAISQATAALRRFATAS